MYTRIHRENESSGYYSISLVGPYTSILQCSLLCSNGL